MTEPTGIKCWSSFHPYFPTRWEQSFDTIYKSTKDDKFRDFGYHRILVTNNELKKFKIKNEVLCKNPISSYNVLQMLNSIIKSHLGLMCPIILP